MDGAKPSFILFRRGDRILCNRKSVDPDCMAFVYEGREYRLVANLYEHCHLLDEHGRLGGFELHDFGKYELRLKQSRFLTETKNHDFDGYFLRIRLRAEESDDLENDGACLVAPRLYHDGEEDYLIVFDDLNLREDDTNRWGRFWVDLGFDLAVDSIAPQPSDSTLLRRV
jgi:hypothetical protein